MKIVKPQFLSVLARPFESRREFHLGVSVLAFLPIGETPALLPETAMWPFLAEELPPDQPLDAAIPKARPEFLAVAHAFAPDGIAAPLVRTGIQLGPRIKLLDVYGDRDRDRSRIDEPAAFTSMPIDWTRTYGGAGFVDNPLGKGMAPADGADGRRYPVHNIINPKLGRDGTRIPATFGPVDQMWPARAKLAGTHDDTWLKQDFPGFARDIDWTFFNTAQPDQWLDEPLIGDETYAFKNLHPEHKLLNGRLPGMAPRLFVVRKGPDKGNDFEEVPLSLTTVWFFPHRERLVLVHHGRTRLAEEDGSDIARVVVGADRRDAPRPASDFHAVMLKRTESKDRGLHALRDEDLAPAEWLRPDPALSAPQAEQSARQQVLERKRQRAERDNAATREQLKALGLDPDKYGPKPLPPPRPPPSPEEFPAVVAAARAEAEAERARAEAEAAARNAAIRGELVASGMSDAEIQERLAAKPKGPPAFTAAAMQTELAAQITAMRVLGQLTLELEARLASPETIAQWEKVEADLRNAYRLSAHRQDAADALSEERSVAIRRLVAGDTAAARAAYDLHGVDLSGLDLSGIDLSGVCLDGADLSGASFAKAARPCGPGACTDGRLRAGRSRSERRQSGPREAQRREPTRGGVEEGCAVRRRPHRRIAGGRRACRCRSRRGYRRRGRFHRCAR
jgi:hypothetical protein